MLYPLSFAKMAKILGRNASSACTVIKVLSLSLPLPADCPFIGLTIPAMIKRPIKKFQ